MDMGKQQSSQLLLGPDQRQDQSAAMRAVEASIQDLQQTFQRALALITEQGEHVERIALNIDAVDANLQAGHGQLERYLRGLNTNRDLILKLFAMAFVLILLRFFVM